MVFLDRDGTINEDPGCYVYKIGDFRFIENTLKGLKALQDNNYKLVIITNQSGIGKGYYTEKQYQQVTKYMQKKLQKNGITLEGIFHCSHAPIDNCECRKPKTKLVQEYLKNKEIDLSNSYMLGDQTSDMKFGENLGLHTILLKTGYGGKDNSFEVNPTLIKENLFEASLFIIENERTKQYNW